MDAVENDLIDSYARKQVSGERLERFQAILASSPLIRERVMFAEQFLQVADGRSQAATGRGVQSKAGRWFEESGLWFRGLAAAAAVASIAIASILVATNADLRKRIGQEERDRARLELRVHDLESRTEAHQSPPEPVEEVSFLLAPQMRGPGDIPRITIPRAAQRVVFNLQLETDDFARYRVVLTVPGSETVLWRSEELKPNSTAKPKTVACVLTAGLLEQRNLTLQLSGKSEREPLRNSSAAIPSSRC